MLISTARFAATDLFVVFFIAAFKISVAINEKRLSVLKVVVFFSLDIVCCYYVKFYITLLVFLAFTSNVP